MSELKLNNVLDFIDKEENDKTNNNNNKNNNVIIYSTFSQKDNLKNQRAANKIKNNNKKLKINSISELEFLYNDSQVKTTITNKHIKLKKKNLINLSTNNINSTSEFLTSQKNKKLSRQNKSNSFNNFWKSVNQHEEERKTRINNLKAQITKIQNAQMLSKPKISKRSITLASSKRRNPLYLKKPLNEEIYLESDFLKFYKKNLDFTYNGKMSSDDEKKIQEKFNKFYEDNITWKNQRNDRIMSVRNEKFENSKKNNYSFKPAINKNSIRLVKKLEKINSIYSDDSNLINPEYEQELLDQLKIKLKPVLNECFDFYNKRIPYVNKRSRILVRNSSKNFKTKNLSKSKTYTNLSNTNITKRDKIFKNIPKEEKKNDNLDVINEQIKNGVVKRSYENYLLYRFREIENLNNKNKKELYKLNIRQGTSWNPEVVNYIIPKRNFGFIIEGLL